MTAEAATATATAAAVEHAFAPVAQRVMVRVWVRRWLAWLGRTWWQAALLVGALALTGVLTHSVALGILTGVAVAAWLLVPLGLLWWRKPGHYSTLALWDRAAGRREAFASAWWFEQQAAMSAAEQEHVQAQRRALAAALPALAKDLPLQPNRWLWVPPVVALAALFTTITLRSGPVELALDEDMQQAARDEAKKLADTDWQKKKLEGLKAEEQKDLDKLKENLKQTAQNLENSQGRDAREVMADLERRAREAEKLAEKLGADKEQWASDKLVDALRKHADTADLGDAVASKNAGETARAADELAKQLKSPQLTHDARERMNETLKDTEKDAEKEDRQRTVGQHVLGAGDQLKESKAGEAGQEFEKLADKMRDLARREQTRNELEKLAQQLRDAGSNIAGQNAAGGMQQMSAAGQQGQQGQTGHSSPQVGQSQPNQNQMGQGQNGQQQLQPPGLGQMGQGQQMQMMQQNPVPGTGQPQQMMMLSQAQPGQQGKPMLMAPVPGMKPGEKPDGFMLGPPGGDPNGPMIALAMPGGQQPGLGTAELNAEATATQNSGSQSVVAAQQNNEGQSSVRSVEGGARKEQAGRSASQIAVESIAAEEEALDEAALPPGRRQQVRRYFTELRKRFEKQ